MKIIKNKLVLFFNGQLPRNLFIFDASQMLSLGKFKLIGLNSKPIFFNLANSNISSGAIFKVPLFFFFFFNKSFFSLSVKTYKFLPGFLKSIYFFINQFFHAVVGASYGHYNIIQLVGFRYQQRWFRSFQVLRYRFGYNQKIWFRCPADFGSIIQKISPKKKTHYFFSRDLISLRTLIYSIYKYRPATIYKGRGVNFKEQPMVLKEGKKALW